MSAQHTPGPWLAREWSRRSPTTVVREIGGVVTPIADVDGVGHDPATIANARLIAAAPDLLALARRYASECGECGGTGRIAAYDPAVASDETTDCPDCADIRVVIAQATAP